MIEQQMVLMVGSLEVVSELEYDASHPDHTVIRVVSSCGGHRSVNTVTLKHRVDYTDAQAEFDIEDARWRYAEALAGKVAVRTSIPRLLLPVTDAPRKVTKRERSKPNYGMVPKVIGNSAARS